MTQTVEQFQAQGHARPSIIGEGRLLVPEQKRQKQAEKEHLKRKVSQ